jgi:outer membrane receptor for ferrienterochelin and colicins
MGSLSLPANDLEYPTRARGVTERRSRFRGVVVASALLFARPICGWADEDDDAALHQIVVTATRTPGLIRDEPLRVEAVPAEEIEENLTVQPGNLSSLLNELPGVRVQSTTAGLGGAGLQLRGMPTRHTLVLMDGLPLLGAEPDGFGLLQTPPLDLARVEVIKGAASALYGGASLGGVLNLVSQSAAANSSVLANATSRGGRDLEGFFTQGGSTNLSGTLTAGVHDQSREDPSGEGWADIPGYRRYTVRPRVWWNLGQDQSLFFTSGLTDEYREGGTLNGRVLPGGMPFLEALHTQRVDGGVVSHWRVNDVVALDGHLSVTSTNLDRIFGGQRIDSTQTTVSGEEAVSGTVRGHAWVAGLAFQHDGLSAAAVAGVGYSYNVPGLFVQDEFSPAPWLKFAGSARIDSNNEYGTFFSPRLSALLRPPGSKWSLRASVGGGYAGPTPFVDEIEATGLGSLLPLRGLHAERAVTESLDAKWANEGLEVNVSVFSSEIRDALTVQEAPGDQLQLFNAPGPRRAPGAEILIHYVVGPLQAIGSWSYINATEAQLSGIRQAAPLVPRDSGELGAILEKKQRGRVGLEMGYTGRQALEDDPYRSVSEPYFELNALGEIRIGNASIFINAINLTDVRQTRFDPLVRPSPGLGGNPITEVWAPLDGRTFNLGIRVDL